MTSTSSGESHEDVVANGSKSHEEARGFFGRIALFFSQVFAELKKVVTPTRQELIRFTLVVLAFVVLMMAFIWGLDQLFGWLVIYVFGNPAALLQ